MNEACERAAALGRAFTSGIRLRILAVLAREEACVCHLTVILGARQAQVSQHLRVLKDTGLVTFRRDGVVIYYRLADARVAVILSMLQELSQKANPDLRFEPIPDSPVPGCRCPRCKAAQECGE